MFSFNKPHKLANGVIIALLANFWLFKAEAMASQAEVEIIQRPILFNQERESLSLEYLKQRYAMTQSKAIITAKMVVVHWTAINSLEDSFAVFNSVRLPLSRAKISRASALNVSAHFLIDRDGTIYQLLPETTFARHVIGLNHAAIGIENVGDGASYPLTEKQLQSNIKLIKYLSKRHPIEYVIGHYEYKSFIGHPLWKEVDPGYLTDKTDPGVEFINHVRAGLSEVNLKVLP